MCAWSVSIQHNGLSLEPTNLRRLILFQLSQSLIKPSLHFLLYLVGTAVRVTTFELLHGPHGISQFIDQFCDAPTFEDTTANHAECVDELLAVLIIA